MGEAAVEEQGDEDQDVYLSFPDFGWPQGLTAVGVISQSRVGIDDAEVTACRMAEGVAVHEIGHAADGLAQDDSRCQEVGKGPGVDVMVFGIHDAGDGAKEQATLDGHAALPDVGDFCQVVVVVRPVEEEDVPQPAADDA